MPMPGGRVAPGGRPAPAEPRATAAEQAEASEATAVASGLNPLLAAANRLLNVLPQLRCRSSTRTRPRSEAAGPARALPDRRAPVARREPA